MTGKSVLFATGDSNRLDCLVGPDFGIRKTLASDSGYGRGIAISSDHKTLALTINSKVRIFDLETWQEIDTSFITGLSSPWGVALSSDGTLLAVSHYAPPYINIFNLSTKAVVNAGISQADRAETLAFSHDDTRLFSIPTEGSSGNFKAFNTSDWSTISGTPDWGSYARCMAVSPDSSMIVFGFGGSPYLEIWDTNNWTKITDIASYGGSTVYDVAFSGDGQYLAVGSYGSPRLSVFRTSDWTQVTEAPTYSVACYAVAFSDSGQLLAVGTKSGVIDVIDTATWTKVSGTANTSGEINSISISDPGDIAVPTRRVQTKDFAGNDLAATLHLSDRSFNKMGTYESSGEIEIWQLQAGDFWLAMPDERDGAKEDAFSRITLNATSGDLPPLVLTQGYIGDLVTISSNLTTQAGAPGDEVVIRNWTTRELVAKVIPDANGDWSAEVPPGTYDVSYIAENCAPVIHGPYTVELP